MDTIDNNIIDNIAKYLNFKDLKQFSITNKHFRPCFYDKCYIHIFKCKTYNMLEFSLDNIKYVAITSSEHFEKFNENNHDMLANIQYLNDIKNLNEIRIYHNFDEIHAKLPSVSSFVPNILIPLVIMK